MHVHVTLRATGPVAYKAALEQRNSSFVFLTGFDHNKHEFGLLSHLYLEV